MRYFLNIGLNVSPARAADAYGAAQLVPDHALTVLLANLPQGARVYRTQTLPATATAEPTLVVLLYVPGYVPASRWRNAADALLQDCIAVVPAVASGPRREDPNWAEGGLYGPRADEWGPFNKAYFRQFEDAQP